MTQCYCGSGKVFSECCEPYILGFAKAPTAEALMRSRYSAYAVHNAGYLWNTTHPKERKNHSQASMLNWAKSNQWLKLEILFAGENIVEFNAYYLDETLHAQVHHEKSSFALEKGSWFYVDGKY